MDFELSKTNQSALITRPFNPGNVMNSCFACEDPISLTTRLFCGSKKGQRGSPNGLKLFPDNGLDHRDKNNPVHYYRSANLSGTAWHEVSKNQRFFLVFMPTFYHTRTLIKHKFIGVFKYHYQLCSSFVQSIYFTPFGNSSFAEFKILPNENLTKITERM